MGQPITIEAGSSSRDIERLFQKYGANGKKALDKAMRDTTIMAQREIISKTPKKTGRAAQFWAASLKKVQNGVYEISGNRAARLLEEGTKPHPIIANKAKALVFAWPKMGGGNLARITGNLREGVKRRISKDGFSAVKGLGVFKRVNHPGTKALKIVENTKRLVPNWMKETTARYLKEIGK